jgi:hypothetical protein
MPTLRILFAVVLSLLLHGTQLGALTHALEHDGNRLRAPHHAALMVPAADGACAICASFAGGTHASTGPQHASQTIRPSDVVAVAVVSTRAGSAPAYFQSRAPPALL